MKGVPSNPETRSRLRFALIISFLITAVISFVAFAIGGLMPAPFRMSDLLEVALIFFVVFLFWYCIWVRQNPRTLEFDKLAGHGEEIIRDMKRQQKDDGSQSKF